MNDDFRPDPATRRLYGSLDAVASTHPSMADGYRSTSIALLYAEFQMSAPFRAVRHNVDPDELLSRLGLKAVELIDGMIAGTVRRPRNLAAFAARVVRNTAIEAHRRDRTRDAMRTALEFEVAASGRLYDNFEIGFMIGDQVTRLIARLSREERLVALLPACGYSDAEIGEILGIKANAVVQRRHRLRLRLASEDL